LDHYTVDSYRRAIARACDEVFPPPEPLARRNITDDKGTRREKVAAWKSRLGPERLKELKIWRNAHRWPPHQLRHNAGTNIRREFGVEAARVILGHCSIYVFFDG
jgi:integrase